MHLYEVVHYPNRFKTVSEAFNILCFEREPTEFGYTRKQQDEAFMKTPFVQIVSKQLGPCLQIMSPASKQQEL